MAKYGVRRYGTFKYGQLDSTGVYFNSGITAKAVDYNKTHISWNTMSYDPNRPTPTHWRLVKSFTGTPDDPFDAVLVQGGALSLFSTSYVETFVDKPNSQVNYSLWLFNSEGWIFCGSADTIIVDQTTTLNKLTKWIPRAWLNNTVEKIGDATGEPESTNVLEEILYAYSFMYDKIAVEGLLLERTSDQAGINNSLVLPKILDLGCGRNLINQHFKDNKKFTITGYDHISCNGSKVSNISNLEDEEDQDDEQVRDVVNIMKRK